MTAQIIEFPMERVRKPIKSTNSRLSDISNTAPQVRASVKIARLAIVAGLVFTLFYVMWQNVSSGLSPAQANTEVSKSTVSGNFAYVTVMPGQTLWSIASDYAPNQDPRDFIANLVSLNNLNGTELVPGMQIALPLN